MTTTSSTAAGPADLTPGTTIGPWERDTGLDNWNRFAAVNYEFVPIHMDDEAGRAAGMPGAFGPGNLLISYLHALVRDWMGPSGSLAAISAEFRKPNLKGPISATGTITSSERTEAGTTVQLTLTITDAAGAVLVPGTAVVRFPA